MSFINYFAEAAEEAEERLKKAEKETEKIKKDTEILNKIGEKQVALIVELEKKVRDQPKIDQLKADIVRLENTR